MQLDIKPLETQPAEREDPVALQSFLRWLLWHGGFDPIERSTSIVALRLDSSDAARQLVEAGRQWPDAAHAALSSPALEDGPHLSIHIRDAATLDALEALAMALLAEGRRLGIIGIGRCPI